MNNLVDIFVYNFVLSDYNWLFGSNLNKFRNFNHFLDNFLYFIDFRNLMFNSNDFIMINRYFY